MCINLQVFPVVCRANMFRTKYGRIHAKMTSFIFAREQKIQAFSFHWCWVYFLQNRRQHVLVKGTISLWNEAIPGVSQGSVIGPSLLLIIYINDIPNAIRYLIQLFADNKKISGPVSCLAENQSFQNVYSICLQHMFTAYVYSICLQ